MKKISLLMSLFFVFLVGSVAFAEETEQEKKWGIETELYYVSTEGNTEVTTIAAKNLFTYKYSDKWNTAWKAGALYGKSDGEKNVERYYTELKTNYLVTERFYTSLIVGGEWDDFAGIDSRYYFGPAAGYKIFLGPKHFWFIEAGVEYVSEKYVDDTEDEFPQWRTLTEYDYKFTEKNKFSQSVEYLVDIEDGDDYNAISETSLTTELSDYLSFKTTYEFKYDHMPVPETLEKTTRTLTVALVINF